MLRLLFVWWIALLGVDRVDLLGGRGPALLLPFHVLTVLVVALEWHRRWRTGAMPRLGRGHAGLGAVLLGLLSVIALSVVRSADVSVSLGRALLLTATAVAVPLAIWGASDREDLPQLLARGGRAGLLVALAFNVAALLQLFGALPSVLELGPASLNLEAYLYEFLPRLSGGAADMNRGGLVALIHTLFIALARPPLRARRAWIVLGASFVLGSLSRSVLLAAVPMLLLAPRLASTRAQRLRALAVVLALAAVASATLLDPGTREAASAVLEPIALRVNPEEGSARAHAFLFARALEVATQSPDVTLLGVGFGTSYRLLTDFFAGNRYGNFHSTWLTLWVESGVFAMLLALALLVVPLRRRGPLSGALLGLLAYNAFYNGVAEPLLWVVIALAWIAPPSLGAQGPWLARAPAPPWPKWSKWSKWPPWPRRPLVALAPLLLLTLAACDSLLTRPIPYATVRVQAVSRSGAPLPGIRAELYTSFRPMGYAVTDAAGRAVFTRVPKGNYGVLMLPPPEYALLSELLPVPAGNVIDGLQLSAGLDTTVHFVFARRGPGALEALVVDSANAPIRGIEVTLYRSSGILGKRVTNLDGLARFDSVAFGQYGVFVVPPDSIGAPSSAPMFRDGLAVDADVVPRARFVIDRCLGSIRATVLDGAGAPAAGVNVRLYRSSGVARSGVTGTDGSWTFADVACGNWGVQLSGTPGYSYNFVRGEGFVDGLQLTRGATLGATLRVTRDP